MDRKLGVNIVYFFSDGLNEYNSSNFRVAYISDALMANGHHVTILNIREWINQTDECRRACAVADIIHLQRVLIDQTHEYIKYWTSRGKAVVADWDDSYDRILPSNAAAEFWLHGQVTVAHDMNQSYKKKLERHPLEQFRAGLRICTAGTTPSALLSEDWKQYTETFVVKNYINTDFYTAPRKRTNGKHLILGWGGSMSHTQSWEDSGIQEALARILRERSEAILLIVGDDRIVGQLDMLPKDKIIFHPYVPWWQWPDYLAMYDIGLAPLAGPYDDRRSSLKLQEYTVTGKPFVATDSPVYSEFKEADSGRFIISGHEKDTLPDRIAAWEDGLNDVLDNFDTLSRISKEQSSFYIDEYDSFKNVGTVVNTYERIIDLV